MKSIEKFTQSQILLSIFENIGRNIILLLFMMIIKIIKIFKYQIFTLNVFGLTHNNPRGPHMDHKIKTKSTIKNLKIKKTYSNYFKN